MEDHDHQWEGTSDKCGDPRACATRRELPRAVDRFSRQGRRHPIKSVVCTLPCFGQNGSSEGLVSEPLFENKANHHTQYDTNHDEASDYSIRHVNPANVLFYIAWI